MPHSDHVDPLDWSEVAGVFERGEAVPVAIPVPGGRYWMCVVRPDRTGDREERYACRTNDEVNWWIDWADRSGLVVKRCSKDPTLYHVRWRTREEREASARQDVLVPFA